MRDMCIRTIRAAHMECVIMRYSPFVEDETRNDDLNGNRNPEWCGDSCQLQTQIQQKSQFEFVP